MFYGVYNYKQAVLQEMEYQGWHNSWSESKGDPTILDIVDSQDLANYYVWKYYKDFYNMAQVGPVLVPVSSAKKQFKLMRTLVTGEAYDDISDSEINQTFSPFYEIISTTSDLAGETTGEAVIGIGSRLSNYLNSSYDNNSEGYGLYVYNKSLYTNQVTNDKSQFFKRLFSGKVEAVNAKQSSIKEGELLSSLETWMDYVDTDGSIKKTNPVLWRVSENWGGDKTSTPIDNYMYFGKNIPRQKDDTREYMLYMKFEENKPGQILPIYHYYPLVPFMQFDSVGYISRYANDDILYNSNISGLPFSFQPFNSYQPVREEHFITGNAIALPPIAFSTNNQLPVLAVYPSTEYWYSMVIIPEAAIKQYFYLIDTPVALYNQDGSLTPFADLYKGEQPSNPGGGSTGEGGETSGNSGDINWDAFDDTNFIPPAPVIGGSGKHPLTSDFLEPGFYGGVYIPTYRLIKKISDDYNSNQDAVDTLNYYVDVLTKAGKLDALAEVFIHYSEFVNYKGVDSKGNYYDYRWRMGVKEVDVERPLFIAGYNGKDGYYPINNKVLTYPFVSFEMNGYGQRNEIKFENWGGSTPTFCLASKFQPGATVMMIPKNYEGVLYNFDASVTAQPLPIMSYTRDEFKNEYNAGMSLRAQSMAAAEQQMGFNIISAGVGALTGAGNSSLMEGAAGGKGSKGGKAAIAGSIIGGVVQAGGAILSYHQQKKAFEAQLQDVERRPLSVVNQNAAPSMPALMGNYVTPFCVWKSVRKEFAIKIDEYFSRYGYKVNKFKQPKIKTRPIFNYMQLADARVTGKIPNDDLSTIKQILEKGITFWHDTSKIGEYSRSVHESNQGKKGKPVYLYPTYENV